MKSIILEKSFHFIKREIPGPTSPGFGEVLLRVKRIGVCGTDLHAYTGNQPFFNYPRILGHELAVEVLETGEGVTELKLGDRCSVEPYYNFTNDQAVRMGKSNCGDNLRVFGVHDDGGMQEFITYPAKYLHRSSLLNLDQLALIEPLAIGCHAVDRAEINSKDIILIIGAGPIGQAALQFAKLSGARIIMMDINEERLSFCKKTFGVERTFIASGNSKGQLEKYLGGDLPTIIFDATGNAKSMMNTFDLASPGATIVFVGLVNAKITFDDPEFHKKELTLKATRSAISRDFKRAIRLVEDGLIDPSPWITHRLDFDEVVEKFGKIGNTNEMTIKVIIDIDN